MRLATPMSTMGGRPCRAPWWFQRAIISLPAAATLRAGHPCPSLRAASSLSEIFSLSLFFANRDLDSNSRSTLNHLFIKEINPSLDLYSEFFKSGYLAARENRNEEAESFFKHFLTGFTQIDENIVNGFSDQLAEELIKLIVEISS